MILEINRDTNSTSQPSGDSFILPGCELGIGASPNVFQVFFAAFGCYKEAKTILCVIRNSSIWVGAPFIGNFFFLWKNLPLPWGQRVCGGQQTKDLFSMDSVATSAFSQCSLTRGDFLNCRLGTKGKARAWGSFSSQGAANSFHNSFEISKKRQRWIPQAVSWGWNSAAQEMFGDGANPNSLGLRGDSIPWTAEPAIPLYLQSPLESKK